MRSKFRRQPLDCCKNLVNQTEGYARMNEMAEPGRLLFIERYCSHNSNCTDLGPISERCANYFMLWTGPLPGSAYIYFHPAILKRCFKKFITINSCRFFHGPFEIACKWRVNFPAIVYGRCRPADGEQLIFFQRMLPRRPLYWIWRIGHYRAIWRSSRVASHVSSRQY